MRVYQTEIQALDQWVYYLGSFAWRAWPRITSWHAPQEFELAFSTAPDRAAFLTGLKRLLDAAAPWLAMDTNDEECWLLRDIFHKSQGRSRIITFQDAILGAQQLAAWIRLRERSITVQLLDALQRVVLVPARNIMGDPTQQITVVDPDADIEQTQFFPRFQLLLDEFRQQLPIADAAWQLLRNQLIHFNQSSLQLLKEAEQQLTTQLRIADLEQQLPWLRFTDGTGNIQKLKEISTDFWANLEQVVLQRINWAQQVYQTVSESIKEEPLTAIKACDESGKKLSQRQVALLHIYQDRPEIKPYNANEVAKSFGHTSGYKLIIVYAKTNDRLRTLDVEGREVKPLIRDIAAVLAYLNPQQRQRADQHLTALRAKIS